MAAARPRAMILQDESLRQAALEAYAVVGSEPEQSFDDIVKLAATLCDVPAAAITFIDRDRLWFKARIGVDQQEVPRTRSLCAHAMTNPGTTLVVRDLDSDPSYAKRRRIGGQPPRFYAGVPLLSPDGYPLGVVCVMDLVPRDLSAAQIEGLELLTRQTRHLLELRRFMLEQDRLLSAREAAARRAELERAEWERRHEALRESASRDQLTGLLNRAAMDRVMEHARAEASPNPTPYCLLMIDIDHFKQINDRYGHLLGDQALQAVAAAVDRTIRKGDIAVRYGGEEFLVMLPGVELAGATEIAHRICEAIADSMLPFKLTVSIGVAAGDPVRDRPEETLDRADQALYRAKARGRDCVAVDDTPRF